MKKNKPDIGSETKSMHRHAGKMELDWAGNTQARQARRAYGSKHYSASRGWEMACSDMVAHLVRVPWRHVSDRWHVGQHPLHSSP